MARLIDRNFSAPPAVLRPTLGRDVYLAQSADVCGDVRLGDGVNVWPFAALRGDLRPVFVGAGTNLQEAVICHVANDAACTVGRDCTIGHRAVLHGCTIGDGCLIGIGAIVLNNATIGEESIVGAGAVVAEGSVIPPRSLVLGVPAKVRRPLTEEEAGQGRAIAAKYRELADAHRRGLYGGAGSGESDPRARQEERA